MRRSKAITLYIHSKQRRSQRQQLLFLGVKFLLGDGAHIQQLFQLEDLIQGRGSRRCRLSRRGGGVLAVGDHGEDRDDFGSAVLCVPVDEAGLFGFGRHQRNLEARSETVPQVDGDGHFLADILLLFAQAAAHNGADPAEQHPAHHGGSEAAFGDRHPVLQQLEVDQIRKAEQIRFFGAGHWAAPGLAFGVRKDPPADGVGPAHRLVAPGIFLPGVDVVGDLLEALAGPAVQRAAFAQTFVTDHPIGQLQGCDACLLTAKRADSISSEQSHSLEHLTKPDK